MDQSFARTPFGLVARLALAALLITAWLAPALPDVAEAQAAPLVAQADGACGDKPCEDVKTNQGPCGATPCEDIKPGNPCGDRDCGAVQVTEGPCGAVSCADVPVGQGPCGDKPCAEVTNADVNQAPAGDPNAAAPGTPGAPGASVTTTPGQAGDSNNNQAAKRIDDAENTDSGGSGMLIPLLIVVLAGLVLFWVVRRNRANADNEV